MHGNRIPELTPGSQQWLRHMSASKMAAVLGLSPWESRFSLYHRMAGIAAPQGDSDDKRRGHYLEPAVAAWFADQHPELHVRDGHSWAHPDNQRFTCSPDRLLYDADGPKSAAPTAGLECKTDAVGIGWGTEGTDEIPIYYRIQNQWAMTVTGIPVWHTAVLLGGLRFAQYTQAHNDEDERMLIDAATRFLHDLDNGVRPNIDDHGATYEIVKELHPLIEPREVEVDADIAIPYCQARAAAAAADKVAQHALSALADYMGNAKTATYLGQTIARRQARGEGIPYVVAAKGLPTFQTEKAAA